MALACSCWFNCGDVLRVTVKNFKQRFNRSAPYSVTGLRGTVPFMSTEIFT